MSRNIASQNLHSITSLGPPNNVLINNISLDHKGKKQMFRKTGSVQKGWLEALSESILIQPKLMLTRPAKYTV